jgi:hypothetical protein
VAPLGDPACVDHGSALLPPAILSLGNRRGSLGGRLLGLLYRLLQASRFVDDLVQFPEYASDLIGPIGFHLY